MPQEQQEAFGQSDYETIVVGGGPAGLMAAATAAHGGHRVLLLERMPRLGTKLRITGKGKCNITNTRTIEGYREKIFAPDEAWIPALEKFGNRDIVALLERLGVATVVERGDRVYPESHRAHDVADALGRYAVEEGVEIRCGELVERVEQTIEGRFVLSVRNREGEGGRYTSDTLVMATGGQSYPRTGSDGQGYSLLKGLGHSITELYPSLVGFHTVPRLYERNRFELRNVGVTVRVKGEVIAEDFGDLELTPEGIAGSTILRVSRATVLAMRRGEVPIIVLDLKPARSESQMVERILKDCVERRGEAIHSIARSWLPAPLVGAVLKFANVNPNVRGARVSPSQAASLAGAMKTVRLRVHGHEDWNRAVCTGGGVPWEELNMLDYSSRLVPGLFVCGELLDIDANTGGFNLQIAYSTGVVAGEAARRYVGSIRE